jgi:hypothetical protein
MHSKTHTVSVIVDPDNPEELAIPLPDELLESLGWKVDDTLEWHDNGDGSWTMKKSNTSI